MKKGAAHILCTAPFFIERRTFTPSLRGKTRLREYFDEAARKDGLRPPLCSTPKAAQEAKAEVMTAKA